MASWKEVAIALGNRMKIAASLAGANGDWLMPEMQMGCAHKLVEADPDNCPFCADRAAHLMYVKKVKETTK